MDLTSYRTLGRSGLAVSPLALGTMTFGGGRWGSSDDEARAVFDAYVEAGGNLVDTADVYAGGRSEELVGRLVAERGARVRATTTVECESGLPFAGLHQLTQPLLPQLELLPAPQREAFGVAFGFEDSATPDPSLASRRSCC